MQKARIFALIAILGYFAVQFWPSGSSAKPAPTLPAQNSTPTSSGECAGRILEAAASPNELNLKVTGAAETLRVSYDGGMIVQATENVCSAGYCRVFTPSPARLVQLDDCPAITLP